MSQLRISAFAGLSVEREGQPLGPFPTQKAAALLAYLLTFRTRPHPRLVLAGLLWPEVPEARARHNLSDAIWRLRRFLGVEVVAADGDCLALNPGCDCHFDVEQFEQHLAAAQDQDRTAIAHLRLAVECYGGEFLAGFYDDWVLRERERLHLAYLGALERLLAWHHDAGETKQALEYGLRLVAADPLRESAHRHVMVLYQRLGQRHAALHQFDVCAGLLRQELEVEPMPETQRLADEIRESLAVDNAPLGQPREVPFVGRRAERAALLARLERAGAGQGGMFLVEGEPGIGKTRLVREVSNSATWRGFQVLWGRCGPEPYAALVQAVGQGLTPLRRAQVARLLQPVHLAALGAVLPAFAPTEVPKPSGDNDPGQRLPQAIVHCLLALAQAAPHVLVMEDWQAIDPASMAVLHLLAPHVEGSRLLLLGTARDGELRGQWETWQQVMCLERSGALEHMALSRLSAGETESLVQHLLMTDSGLPELVAHVRERTGGNPLYVIEWLKALVEGGRLRTSGRGQWVMVGFESGPPGAAGQPVEPIHPPMAIQQVIAERLDRLLPAERHLVDAAGVLHEPFDFDLWCRLTGLDGVELLARSGELQRRQIIVETAAGYRFSHALIREVAYEATGPEVRREWHRRAALALEERGTDSLPALARHLERAGAHRQAAGCYLRAARQARATGALENALRFCGQAIALSDPEGEGGDDGATLSRALCQRAELYVVQAKYPAAEADYRRALAVLGSEQVYTECQAAALEGLGWLLGNNLGLVAEGLALLARARPLYEASGNLPGLAETLVRIGHLTATLGNWGEALDLYARARAVARKAGHRAGEAYAGMGSGVASLFLNRPRDAVAELEAAASLYGEIGDRWRQAKCLTDSGQARLQLPDLPGAMAAFGQAWQINEALGAAGDQVLILVGEAYVHLEMGHVAEARAAAQEGLARLNRLGGGASLRPMLLLHLARAQRVAGELEAALRTLEAGLEAGRQHSPANAVLCLHNLAGLHRFLGDLERARALAEEGLALAMGHGFQAGEIQARVGLAQVLLAQGHREEARQQLGRAGRLARASRDWLHLGRSILGMASCCLALDLPERALALAHGAAEQARKGGAVLLEMEARCQAAEVWLAAGQAEAAREPLGQVLGWAQERNMPGLTWRAATALAEAEPEGARECLAQAWTALQGMASSCSDPVLRAALLTAPVVPSVEARLRQLGLLGGVRRQVLLRPAGRDRSESVAVTWTLDAGPDDEELGARAGKVALRRARLLRLLAEARAAGALPSHDDLAQALEVTRRTIRSDVAALRAQGHEIPTRNSAPE